MLRAEQRCIVSESIICLNWKWSRSINHFYHIGIKMGIVYIFFLLYLSAVWWIKINQTDKRVKHISCMAELHSFFLWSHNRFTNYWVNLQIKRMKTFKDWVCFCCSNIYRFAFPVCWYFTTISVTGMATQTGSWVQSYENPSGNSFQGGYGSISFIHYPCNNGTIIQVACMYVILTKSFYSAFSKLQFSKSKIDRPTGRFVCTLLAIMYRKFSFTFEQWIAVRTIILRLGPCC